MRIAVTGGTGRIGGRVVELLTGTGGHEVVALSSRTAPYDNPSALRAALDGVDTLVFVSSDGEAARVIVHHRNVVEAATQCRVGHVVLLSGLDVDLQSPFCYAYTNGDTERLLRASGRPYSIVRASLFTEFFLSLLLQVSSGDPDGTVALPAAQGRVSLVAREDVARCLAALALGEPTGRHHDVTGPDSLPVDAVAAMAGYRYTETTPPEFAGRLLRRGEALVDLRLHHHVRIHPAGSLGDGVRRGRRTHRSPIGLATPGAEPRYTTAVRDRQARRSLRRIRTSVGPTGRPAAVTILAACSVSSTSGPRWRGHSGTTCAGGLRARWRWRAASAKAWARSAARSAPDQLMPSFSRDASAVRP
jgi:NAD(P)H dehydrogenase (quinone)